MFQGPGLGRRAKLGSGGGFEGVFFPGDWTPSGRSPLNRVSH